MLQRTQWDNGPHKLEFEAPDIYHVYLLAPVQGHEALKITKVLEEEILPHVGEVFVLVHLGPGFEALSSATRRTVASVKPSWSAVAIVGGTTLSRAVMNMTLRALTLLSGKQPPTRMVKTVEEAYAFFGEQRATHRPKAATG